jgi:hypothetical protein
VAVAVDLYYEGEELRDLRTRNVSLGGVFLEPGDYAPPPAGASVELTFRLAESAPAVHRVHARVQRSGPFGVALLFRNFRIEDFGFLQQLLTG